MDASKLLVLRINRHCHKSGDDKYVHLTTEVVEIFEYSPRSPNKIGFLDAALELAATVRKSSDLYATLSFGLSGIAINAIYQIESL